MVTTLRKRAWQYQRFATLLDSLYSPNYGQSLPYFQWYLLLGILVCFRLYHVPSAFTSTYIPVLFHPFVPLTVFSKHIFKYRPENFMLANLCGNSLMMIMIRIAYAGLRKLPSTSYHRSVCLVTGFAMRTCTCLLG